MATVQEHSRESDKTTPFIWLTLGISIFVAAMMISSPDKKEQFVSLAEIVGGVCVASFVLSTLAGAMWKNTTLDEMRDLFLRGCFLPLLMFLAEKWIIF